MVNSSAPEVCVVVPVFNEEESVGPLCREIDAALGEIPGEAVFVDDGSSDKTLENLLAMKPRYPWLRVVSHPTNAGQSAAFVTGVRAASAPLIATLDGDGQNDPADVPVLVRTWQSEAPGCAGHLLVAGHRAERRDNWIRRLSSRVANHVRRFLLDDGCLDTGCSLKVFRRDDFMLLPQFDHMHRFLPALFAREGIPILNVPVNHRPREAGISKYGVGNRLWVGVVDLLGARWLKTRPIRLSPDARQRTREL